MIAILKRLPSARVIYLIFKVFTVFKITDDLEIDSRHVLKFFASSANACAFFYNVTEAVF